MPFHRKNSRRKHGGLCFTDNASLGHSAKKELADYIDRRIADFDATEDLNLQGILSIGLII